MELSPRTRHVGIAHTESPTRMPMSTLQDIACGFARKTYGSIRLPPKYNVWILAEHPHYYEYLDERHIKVTGVSVNMFDDAIAAIESGSRPARPLDFSNPVGFLAVGSRAYLAAAIHFLGTGERRAEIFSLHLMRAALKIRKSEVVWVDRRDRSYQVMRLIDLLRSGREGE